MKNGILALITLTACIMTSCHFSNKELDKADGLMQEMPDSALVLLQQWQRDNPHPSKRDEARHALLLSMALDKNYIDLQSDSIIDKAVRYYALRKGRERMLAYYYQSRISQNCKLYSAAIVSIENAEKDARVLKDNLYMGLIYRNKATIFTETGNNSSAIECAQRSIGYFRQLQNSKYEQYERLSLATFYANDLNYDEALNAIDSIHIDSNDLNLIYQVTLRKANILWSKMIPPREILSLYMSVPPRYYDILDFGHIATIYESLNKKDSADFWISQGYERPISEDWRATLDYQRARIEQMRGNYKNAYELMYHVTNFQDSLTRIRLTESVSSSQRDYFKKEMELETEKARTNAMKLRLLIFISILAIAILVLFFMDRLRSSNAKLRESLAALHSSSESVEKLRKDNVMLAGSLLSEKLLFLDKLSYDYCHSDTEKLKDAIFEQYKGTIRSLKNEHQVFDEIEAILNKYYDGILDKFQEQFPQIRGEKLQMATLFFTKLPFRTIQILLKYHSVDSLKQAKNRLRKTIFESDAPDKALFLEMLKMKKGGRK